MTRRELAIGGIIVAIVLAEIIVLLDWSWIHGRGDLYATAFKCVVQTDSILKQVHP